MSLVLTAGLRGITHLPRRPVVSTTTTQIRKIGTVCVPISDQERAIQFYVDTLGFELRADVPFGEGYRWVEVAPAGADTTVAIVPPPPGTPAGNMQKGIALQKTDIRTQRSQRRRRGRKRGSIQDSFCDLCVLLRPLRSVVRL